MTVGLWTPSHGDADACPVAWRAFVGRSVAAFRRSRSLRRLPRSDCLVAFAVVGVTRASMLRLQKRADTKATLRASAKAKLKIVTQGEWRKLQATSNIDAGEVILEERPLLTWKRGSVLETAQNAIAAFAELPQVVQEQIRGYYSPPKLPPALSIIQDSFSREDLKLLSMLEVCCSGTLAGSAALFHHVACANHSCRPNAVIRTKEDSELRIMALRSIVRGNEICFSYINEDLLLKPSNFRRRILQKSWGFHCNCPRCSEDDSSQHTSTSENDEDRASWRMQLREEQEASEDARMRRFALGLGTPKQWKQRAERLRKRQWLQELVNFYHELLESQKLPTSCKSIKSKQERVSSAQQSQLLYAARDASEAHLWRGEVEEALEAAKLWRAFVVDLLGTTMSLESQFQMGFKRSLIQDEFDII